MMKEKKTILAGFLGLALTVLATGYYFLDNAVNAASDQDRVPRFEVDPFWPQPLPNKWILGRTIGVDVDARDHVFIVHRDSDDMFMTQELGLDLGNSQCCTAAPPILEFDLEGNLINAWGGPSATGEYEWPASNHGIEIAANGDIWIGGNGSGDSHVLVFSRAGEYIRTVGEPGNGRDSNSRTHFARVAEIAIDEDAGEAYLADGYVNRRVAVVDVATGALKRFWGAYGNVPDDAADNSYTPGQPPPQQFRGPVHCAEPSTDGLIYVCDRGGDRIQVFRPDGSYVKEAMILPATLAMGSTWDIAFSQDEAQEFIYVADGSNMKVHIIDRDSLEILYSFGEGGRQPGMFFSPHSIATDSEGNIYTTETYEGKRVQKFLYKGMGPLRDAPTGPASSWPASAVNG